MTWWVAEAGGGGMAAQGSSRAVQMGLQHVSTGAFADARQWIKEGRVGKITAVESWVSRNTPRGHGQWVRAVPSDCTADHVDWGAVLNGRPARPVDPFALIYWGAVRGL